MTLRLFLEHADWIRATGNFLSQLSHALHCLHVELPTDEEREQFSEIEGMMGADAARETDERRRRLFQLRWNDSLCPAAWLDAFEHAGEDWLKCIAITEELGDE